MKQAEVGDYRIETNIGKRKRFGISFLEVDLRVKLSSPIEHLRRSIHPKHPSAACPRSGGNVPRTCREIEHPRLATDASRVEQLVDDPTRDRPEYAIVRLGTILGPAPALEFVERVRVALAHNVSPHLVGMEDVILRLHFHMTHVPARGGATFIGLVSGRRRVIVELCVPPAAGPRKSLADLLHEEKVRQSIRHVYDERGFRALFRL